MPLQFSGVGSSFIRATNGLPSSTAAMTFAIRFRYDSPRSIVSVIANLTHYEVGANTAHVLAIDTDGQSLNLYSNYYDSPTVLAVLELVGGSTYTAIVEGNAGALTVYAGELSDSLSSAATTQAAFVPTHLFYGEGDADIPDPTATTLIDLCILNRVMTSGERSAYHANLTIPGDAITNRDVPGNLDLANSLSSGFGAAFTAPNGGVTVVEIDSGLTLEGTSEIDLTTPDGGLTLSGTSEIDLTTPDTDIVPAAITTTSISTATSGTGGTQTLTAVGSGTVTFTATAWPAGYSMTSGGVITWTTGALPGLYSVTITPTSSVAGVGTPKTFPITVIGATVDDSGAWAPLLRRRLA